MLGLVVVLRAGVSLGLTGRYAMQAREIPPLGVDIMTPDFAAMARSFHIDHHAPKDPQALRALLLELATTTAPVMIELDAAVYLAS